MEALNGRVVLLCDNSPVALLLPAVFNSFVKVSEDRYNRFEMVNFQRLLRYAAIFAALLSSGFYLAVINFHTQIIPANPDPFFCGSAQRSSFPKPGGNTSHGAGF